MKFCSECGAKCREGIPEGDNRTRSICTECGAIHYVNPKIVVGCIVEHDDKLLLCRRAIEPSDGLWTFPAGYLELHESTADTAARETEEEACAEVEDLIAHSILDIPHIGQTYVIYRCRLKGDHFATGLESREVTLLARDDLPWAELAFPVIRFALELYFADKDRGAWRVHSGTVAWNSEGSRYDYRQYELRDLRSG